MGEQLNLESRIQRSSEPMQARLDDELVMMSVERGSYYGLDPVGSKIWELLEEPLTVSELVSKLVDIYDVDQSVCERETIEFLESMQDEKLVEPASA